MKSSRYACVLTVAFLGFAAVPSYWIFYPPEEAFRQKALIATGVVLVGAAWALARFLVAKMDMLAETKQDLGAGSSLDDCLKIRDKTQTETAGLRRQTKRLVDLTDQHQQHASKTTTAAAQATESATGIASAIEEMNSAIQEIGRQADEAAAIADQAVQKSVSANQSVVTLTEHTDKILSMLELIRSIAQKTNLLALNASIEAARAGEHGKGFSVVAQEVKALANQTATATKQIEAQVGSVRDSSKDARTHMTEVQGVIEQISAITTTIKGALQQEEAATKEIAASATMTTSATHTVTQGISYLLVTTEEIRASCVEINEHIATIDAVVRDPSLR